MIEEENGQRKIGVIAQDMMKILPEVVRHDPDYDNYGVDYGNITAILIEAIKDLKAEVEELKKK